MVDSKENNKFDLGVKWSKIKAANWYSTTAYVSKSSFLCLFSLKHTLVLGFSSSGPFFRHNCLLQD